MLDDDVPEGAEHFVILLESVVGTTTSSSKVFRVRIEDNDGPDPILREIGRHVAARTEALTENQPRLIPMLRNVDPLAAEFALCLTGGCA